MRGHGEGQPHAPKACRWTLGGAFTGVSRKRSMLRLSSAQVSVRRMLRPALSPPKGSHRSGRCSPVRSSRGGSRRPSFDSAQDRLSCREPTRPWILRRCSGQVSARQLVGSVMRERIFSPALSCVEGSRALPRAVAADPCPEHFDCAQCKLRRRDADDLAALHPSIALRAGLEGDVFERPEIGAFLPRMARI